MQKQQSFYYTFGTSDSQPYKRGWVEVKAAERGEADTLFRMRFPDQIPGVLNCSSVFDEQTFHRILSETYAGAPDWCICHEVISLQKAPGERTSEDIYEYLRDTESTKGPDTINLGVSMYHIAANVELQPPMTSKELKVLADKVQSCWLSGIRTTDDVEFAVCHMLDEGITQVRYYDPQEKSTKHPAYSRAAARHVLLNGDSDLFHFLINAKFGHQPTMDRQNPDGSPTILGTTLESLERAEQELSAAINTPALSDKIRQAEGRSTQQQIIQEPTREQEGGRSL